MSEKVFTFAELRQRIRDVRQFTQLGMSVDKVDYKLELTWDEWMDLRADPEFAQSFDFVTMVTGGKLTRLIWDGTEIILPNGA